jgi:hypothetical protein
MPDSVAAAIVATRRCALPRSWDAQPIGSDTAVYRIRAGFIMFLFTDRM